MPRRVSLPAADELFRTTGGSAVQPSAPQQQGPGQSGQVNGEAPKVPAPAGEADPGTGRREHTSADEQSNGAGSEAGAGGEHGREPRSAGGDEQRAAHAPAQSQAQPYAPQTPQQSSQQSSQQQNAGGGGRGAGAKGRQAAAGSAPRRGSRGANRRPSGRERHDEKITVYVSAEELMDLEHARLVLRGEHGLAVDRGRIVREAVAVVLADLESRGDASILVRRLRGR